MGIRLIMRDAVVEKRRLMMDLEVHCKMERPSARAPRIELVFENDWDNRRMVIPQRSFLPKKGDNPDNIWIFKAKYSYFLHCLFWYGTWDRCRLHFDIDFDGQVYENVPIKLKLRKKGFDDKDLNAADAGEADEDEELDTESEEDVTVEDLIEFGPDYLDVILGEPYESKPPVQPNRIQVVLGILLRLCNGILGLIFIPWYCIDSLGIILLPTEKKDGKLNQYGFFGKFYRYVLWRYFSFCRNSGGKVSVKRGFLKLVYHFSNAFHRHKKNVLFLSNRRADMTGNFEYVYEYLKEIPGVKIDFFLNPNFFKDLSLKDTFLISWKCGKAKVILVDDFVSYIRTLLITQETRVLQLWHACGAFKTFGFSRLGKKGGPKQKVRAHRDYSYCFVSSKNIAKYYAEGFGVAQEKILPYGVPRTDMFFDKETRKKKRESFFETYPNLRGKKIVLFAPTFRGSGKGTAFYDADRFDPNKVISRLPEDYVLLIKHHPFVTLEYRIEKKNKDRIFDFSLKSEINDILFATDVLITDYSSVIYEASILNIPMIFYAYDLEDYIVSRDFYFEYTTGVPGKIVYNQEELVKALVDEDYELEKVEEFCRHNFDIQDGKASKRIADFVADLAQKRD